MPTRTVGKSAMIPDVSSLRIPVRYLANLLTAGKEEPVLLALERMLAMRAYKRSETVHGERDSELLARSAWTTPPCRTCTASWPSPTTRTASWCPAATRKWSRTASTRRAAAASPSATAAGGVSEGSLFGKKPQGSEIFIDMPKSRKKAAAA